jgi:hypothetical protein
MRVRRPTVVLAVLTLIALVASAPASLREAYDRGGLYLFSREFLEDVPARLTGPGRFRLVFQPLGAIVAGSLNGAADARAGRPPYQIGLLRGGRRAELATSGFASVINLVLMGILMDSLFQWFLFGTSYPGAAIVLGPMLIVGPYAVARALANRFTRARART